MYREEQLTSLLCGHRILIAGYGREGRSAERLLQRLAPSALCGIADGNDQIRQMAFSGQYDLVVKSPGVPMRVLRADRPAPFAVTSLTDLFLRVYADLTIGITGTKGKSTTASLIHHLLPGSILAGNIGVPLFDIADQLDEHSIVVAELSCHQLEVLHRSPHIAVLLNLFQEHLDHYDGYADYRMAKMQIAMHQAPADTFFYCTDNAELCRMVGQCRPDIGGSIVPYCVADIDGATGPLIDTCPLKGDHNRSNALVALRVASLATGRPLASFAPLLASFHGLRHRMEYLGRQRGLDWYDDSISTIPAATIAALRALPRVDTLILGGFDRGIDYWPLADYLGRHPVPNLVFVGEAGRRIMAILPGGSHSRSLVCDDYAQIVAWCAEATPQGGTVLLSPAAASYDAFKNFEQRGDFFRDQIANGLHRD